MATWQELKSEITGLLMAINGVTNVTVGPEGKTMKVDVVAQPEADEAVKNTARGFGRTHNISVIATIGRS